MRERGLPDAGDVLEQDVPSSEQRGDGETDDGALAVEDRPDLVGEAIEELEGGRCNRRCGGLGHRYFYGSAWNTVAGEGSTARLERG